METLARTANRGSVSTGPYEIDNSLLLDNSDSSMEYNHHQMSPGGDDQWSAQSNAGTNSKKATISLWIKRAKLSPSSGAGQYARLFQFQTGGNATSLYFVTDQLTMYDDVTSASLKTNRKFRDTSAWYHIVLAMDSTQSTAADRVKLYVNGVQETSWATEDYGNQNSDLAMFSATNIVWYLGTASGNGQGYAFDGYITEFHFVDGAQKAASDFGEYDEDSGIWKPKQYTGSYGILGCYYNFEDTSNNRFNDESGNGNFMNNRGGSFEGAITTDTPTNNFATLNAVNLSTQTLTHGATKVFSSDNSARTAYGTMAPSSGKWWWEGKIQVFESSDAYACIGVTTNLGGLPSTSAQSNGGHCIKLAKAQKWVLNDTGYSYGAAYADNDIINVGLDLDNKKFYTYKNGTIDDANGIDISSTTFDGFGSQWMPLVIVYGSGGASGYEMNFGGYGSYTISSAASDANGYGTFEYAPPSGYYALCTKNLAEYG